MRFSLPTRIAVNLYGNYFILSMLYKFGNCRICKHNYYKNNKQIRIVLDSVMLQEAQGALECI